MATKRETSSGRFVDHEPSGGVSVRLKDLLQSDLGQQRLRIMKEIGSQPEVPSDSAPKRRAK